MLNTLPQDLRYAVRQLRKHPGFTLLATLTLAIGIGAATAVFSLVDAILLRPLPFPEPDRIVALDTLEHNSDNAAVVANVSDTSYPDFFDWRAQAKSFEAMASTQNSAFTMGGAGSSARRVQGQVVSADYFRVLGVDPLLGRAFLRSEEAAGNRSVILSRSLWESAFASSRNVLGQPLQLSEQTYYVVGVMPAGQVLPGTEDTELWVTPASTLEGKNPSGKQRGWHQVEVLARLAPGVTLSRARDEMKSIQAALAVAYPDSDKHADRVSVKPELTNIVGDVARPMHILFAAVCMLLLIACANVAGLMLTRTIGRRSELAVRTVLGATRAQIMSQLMIESVLLCVLGSLPGIALAALAVRLSPRFIPPSLPRAAQLSLDARVLAFAIGASLLTALLFGVLPAWRISRQDPADALRDQTRGNTASRNQQRLQAVLVIAETAIGLVLLVGAGLLIRSFNRTLEVDPGFDATHLMTFRVGIPPKHFTNEQEIQFSKQVQARLSALPGVSQASYAYPLPLSGGDMSIGFSLPRHATSVGDEPSARASVVAANFFATMKMPLRQGRFFTSADDRSDAAPVIIVNQAFADRFFPHENALGQQVVSELSNAEKAPVREVVGVVANVARGSLTERPEPEYYIPYSQAFIGAPSFVLRVACDPKSLAEAVRSAVSAQDASLPVFNERTYDELLARNTAQQRFQTILLTSFASIALILAAVGLYGVLSFMVNERTQELGVRMALGAQRVNILQLVLGRGMALTLGGLVLGIVAAFGLTRYLETLLFATRALDASTFVLMSALLLAVSLLASLVPAVRASRVDPSETLRNQ